MAPRYKTINIPRDKSNDATAGLMICFMIVGHALLWSNIHDSQLFSFLRRMLFFFMAFFFYKSGMFYKPIELKKQLSKKTKTLMIPFFAYAMFGEIVRWIRMYFQEGDTNLYHWFIHPIISFVGRGGPTGNVPLWFLFALFLTTLVISIIDNCRLHRWVLFVVALGVSIGRTIVNEQMIPPIVFELSNGILYYMLGMLDGKLTKRHVLLFAALYVIIVICCPSYVEFRTGRLAYGSWLLWLLSSTAGIVTFSWLFKLKVLANPILCAIGRNSLHIFAFHWILFDLVCLVFQYQIHEEGRVFGEMFSKVPDMRLFWTLVVVTTLIMPIYVYLLKHLNLVCRFCDK